MERKYKNHVTMATIIGDGWARGFRVGQTLVELLAMGFTPSISYIIQQWNEMDQCMIDDMERARIALEYKLYRAPDGIYIMHKAMILNYRLQWCIHSGPFKSLPEASNMIATLINKDTNHAQSN